MKENDVEVLLTEIDHYLKVIIKRVIIKRVIIKKVVIKRG